MQKTIGIIIIIGIILIIILIVWRKNNKKKWKKPTNLFSQKWRIILFEKIIFYNNLTSEEKKLFEFKIQEFLLNCKITGVGTTINDTDKLLVASSAIIPIFAFPEWKYFNIKEVLLYPKKFNQNFETNGKDTGILGMVGTGYMEGKMILSKLSLHHGFQNETDKKNTAIHEFVHLIDKADGTIDGIPELLIKRQYVIPWLDLMRKKIEDIREGESDINPYGATKKTEFFAVISEYFFERPKLLKRKHPELYKHLSEIFDQKMIDKVKKAKQSKIGRNSPCPCGSGKKYKKCCG